MGERLGYGPSVLATTLTVAIDKFGKGDDHGACCGALVELDAGLVTRRLPKVRIDGPYGAPVVDVLASEFAILVGAGIGMFSCKILVFRHLDSPFRSHTFRLYSQTHLVPTEEKKF